MLRRLIKHPATQAAAAWLLGAYLRVVFATTRWTFLNEEAARLAATPGRPVILAFWHEGLAIMAAGQLIARRRFPQVRPLAAHVLVSRHRDGRLIGEVVQRFGYAMVHASSSKGGASGMLALARLLARGEAVGITPDGPRGPRRVAAAGVGQLAALSGAQVIAVGGATTRMRLLRSWDRMRLPLPFARGVLAFATPITVPRDGAEAAHATIEAAMTEAFDQADAWLAGQKGA